MMKRTIMKALCRGLCLTAWSLAAVASSQTNAPTANVDELVRLALSENPEIRFYEAQIEAAKAGVRLAGQWENPELDLQAGHKRAWSGTAYQNGHALYATLSQRIEFPKRIELRKSIANGDVRLATLGLEKFRATIRNRIRAAVLRHQFANERAETAREVAGRAGELLEVLVQRDPAGVAPLLEKRVIEALLVSLRAQVRGFEQEARRQRTELNYLVQAPLDAAVDLAAMDPVLAAVGSAEELMGIAETNSFDLLFHVAELEQQGFRVKLEKHVRWPDVTLAPFFGRETGGGPQNIIGLGITLPLPIWNRNEPSIDAAKARERQLAASFRVTLRQLHRDIVQHAGGYDGALNQLKEWRPDAISEFRKAAELGDRHYRLGAIEVSTYLELQSQYLNAIGTLLDLRAEAFENLLELELLTGKQLAN
jgi:cobalt-zinc-cadmium efflux system outer membrane protein